MPYYMEMSWELIDPGHQMITFGEACRSDHCIIRYDDMGVSKNWGTPKWMVYNGKPWLRLFECKFTGASAKIS